MEGIAVEYFRTSIDTSNNKDKPKFHSYISGDNEQYAYDSHAHMVHLLKTLLESGRLVSGMSTVWEDAAGCAKKYRFALAIYLMTVMSSSYGIIMYSAINAPGHGNNVFDELNATKKRYLKGEMELMGKLSSDNTTNT